MPSNQGSSGPPSGATFARSRHASRNVNPAGLARAVSAAFIGLELYEGVDPTGATTALDALDRLAVLTDMVDDLGPLAHRALRRRARKERPPRKQATRRGAPPISTDRA